MEISYGVFSRNPVEAIEFTSTKLQVSQDVPLLWRHRLRRGRLVTVPEETSAILRLSDQTQITCAPGTQLSVVFDSLRRIRLKSGEARILASHQPAFPMVVETPLATVKVVGTILDIKIER